LGKELNEETRTRKKQVPTFGREKQEARKLMKKYGKKEGSDAGRELRKVPILMNSSLCKTARNTDAKSNRAGDHWGLEKAQKGRGSLKPATSMGD